MTVKPASVIRDELIGEMAAILYDIAPPDAQRIIARKMDELSWAVQRESQSGCLYEKVRNGVSARNSVL